MNDTFTILDGLSVTAFSILVVFSVLALLAFILTMFSKIMDKTSKVPQQTGTQIPETSNLESDEEELLVARIITSCVLQESGVSNIKIRSIRRVQ